MFKNKNSKRIKVILRFLLSVIVIFGMVVPMAASGATRSSNGRYWPDSVTNIYFRCNPTQFSQTEIQDISAGLNKWNGANSRPEATTLGVDKKYMYVTSESSDNQIYYGDSAIYYGSRAIANCIILPNVQSGPISCIQIELNPHLNFTSYQSSTAYHLQSIIVHEAGHALGVAHCHEGSASCRSSTCPSNVMNPIIEKGQFRYTLQPYDYSSYYVIYQ